MFVTKRKEFIDLYKDKKPLMANFYQYQRKKLDLLMLDGKPLGGQWSYDKENRKRVPKDYEFPKLNLYTSKYYDDLSKTIDKHIKEYMDSTISFAKEKGYVETIFKRKRFLFW